MKQKKEASKMDLVIVVLGILYLIGFKIGTALAICSIVEGCLILLTAIARKFNEQS